MTVSMVVAGCTWVLVTAATAHLASVGFSRATPYAEDVGLFLRDRMSQSWMFLNWLIFSGGMALFAGLPLRHGVFASLGTFTALGLLLVGYLHMRFRMMQVQHADEELESVGG